MRKITEIVIHASATRPDWMTERPITDKLAEIRRWHTTDRGWSDIGYHLLIDRDGTVAAGRPLERTGAHVRGRNTGTIGICLIGGHGSAKTDAFHDNFTIRQHAALKAQIAALQARFGTLRVTGHNQYAAKACPGFSVPQWLATGRDTRAPETPKDSSTEAARLRWRLAEIRDTAASALGGA
ncbi:N-acetylmuramoyl-L-alanine amidase [Marinovum sp.]|uniref:N-acetylmuramoyl-L-alanine amidase n=1 Tax=Marinovum sp. TaxID=2024839 RepID=UPI002B275713|nr:N-acetylmuramoyl-L-alanine amidase [Marinovum sp.]